MCALVTGVQTCALPIYLRREEAPQAHCHQGNGNGEGGNQGGNADEEGAGQEGCRHQGCSPCEEGAREEGTCQEGCRHQGSSPCEEDCCEEGPGQEGASQQADRTSVEQGKSVTVRVDPGSGRTIHKKSTTTIRLIP